MPAVPDRTHRAGRRRLTLFDSIVMLLATAAGVGLITVIWPTGTTELLETHDGDLSPSELGNLAQAALVDLLCFVFPWAAALLFLRLLPPRPRLRRLFLQPGTAAMVVIAVGFLLGTGDALFREATSRTLLGRHFWQEWQPYPPPLGFEDSTRPIFHAITDSVGAAAFGLVVVWLVLACSRVGRPEPSWIDRSGRFVGELFLLIALAHGPWEHWRATKVQADQERQWNLRIRATPPPTPVTNASP